MTPIAVSFMFSHYEFLTSILYLFLVIPFWKGRLQQLGLKRCSQKLKVEYWKPSTLFSYLRSQPYIEKQRKWNWTRRGAFIFNITKFEPHRFHCCAEQKIFKFGHSESHRNRPISWILHQTLLPRFPPPCPSDSIPHPHKGPFSMPS